MATVHHLLIWLGVITSFQSLIRCIVKSTLNVRGSSTCLQKLYWQPFNSLWVAICNPNCIKSLDYISPWRTKLRTTRDLSLCIKLWKKYINLESTAISSTSTLYIDECGMTLSGMLLHAKDRDPQESFTSSCVPILVLHFTMFCYLLSLWHDIWLVNALPYGPVDM